MFRLPPQENPEEERKRVRADVRNNFIIFAVVSVAIRFAPLVIYKVPILN